MPNAKSPTPGEITIMAAGAVALIFSFFDFYTYDAFGTSGGASAWSSGLFPVATLMVLFVVIMALQIALAKFANLSFPPRPAGFTWEQIHLGLGFFATVNAIAWLVVNKGGASFGIGFWLIFVASLAAFVGAVLLQRERGGSSTGF